MGKGLALVGVIITATIAWLLVKGPDDCRERALQSCFNQLGVDPEEDWSDYSFVVIGHIRTGPEKPGPNPNLQKNVRRLLVDDPAFVIALGDLYYSITDASVAGIRDWVTRSIPVPFFNAVGNHDTQSGAGHDQARYAREFGSPSYHFILGSELFIFLEKGATPVLGEDQARQLRDLLALAVADPDIRNVFILTHQVFWSYHNPELEPVFRYRHPVRPPSDYRFFLDELKPVLQSMPEGKRIFLMAGDIGGGRKYLQTFYHREGPITYIATGMGSAARDTFVTVSVNDGDVSLKATRLATGEESSPERYGLEYWTRFYREHPKLAAAADRIREEK